MRWLGVVAVGLGLAGVASGATPCDPQSQECSNNNGQRWWPCGQLATVVQADPQKYKFTCRTVAGAMTPTPTPVPTAVSTPIPTVLPTPGPTATPTPPPSPDRCYPMVVEFWDTAGAFHSIPVQPGTTFEIRLVPPTPTAIPAKATKAVKSTVAAKQFRP